MQLCLTGTLHMTIACHMTNIAFGKKIVYPRCFAFSKTTEQFSTTINGEFKTG